MSNLGVAPGYCRCGCGSSLGFWEKNDRIHGYIKGEPKRFAPGHNARLERASRSDYAIDDRGFDTPCWVWQKSIKASGHGQLKVDGRPVLAHRHYYEQEKGSIPKGMELVPLCGVRACVNPEHARSGMRASEKASALGISVNRETKGCGAVPVQQLSVVAL